MKDRYIKEMKDFIEGLQLRDPEVKKAMHDKMEALAHQGNETGVWEILACASSNHKANVNQIETLTTELNSYREKVYVNDFRSPSQCSNFPTFQL